jgi:hypothetical protein
LIHFFRQVAIKLGDLDKHLCIAVSGPYRQSLSQIRLNVAQIHTGTGRSLNYVPFVSSTDARKLPARCFGRSDRCDTPGIGNQWPALKLLIEIPPAA